MFVVPAWAWIVWLAVTGGSFAILETLALATNINGTLSVTLRRWLGIDPPKRWRRITIPVFAAALIVFVAWFVPHISSVPSHTSSSAETVCSIGECTRS